MATPLEVAYASLTVPSPRRRPPLCRSRPAVPPELPPSGPDFTAPDDAPLKTKQVRGAWQRLVLMGGGREGRTRELRGQARALKNRLHRPLPPLARSMTRYRRWWGSPDTTSWVRHTSGCGRRRRYLPPPPRTPPPPARAPARRPPAAACGGARARAGAEASPPASPPAAVDTGDSLWRSNTLRLAKGNSFENQVRRRPHSSCLYKLYSIQVLVPGCWAAPSRNRLSSLDRPPNMLRHE